MNPLGVSTYTGQTWRGPWHSIPVGDTRTYAQRVADACPYSHTRNTTSLRCAGCGLYLGIIHA